MTKFPHHRRHRPVVSIEWDPPEADGSRTGTGMIKTWKWRVSPSSDGRWSVALTIDGWVHNDQTLASWAQPDRQAAERMAETYQLTYGRDDC